MSEEHVEATITLFERKYWLKGVIESGVNEELIDRWSITDVRRRAARHVSNLMIERGYFNGRIETAIEDVRDEPGMRRYVAYLIDCGLPEAKVKAPCAPQ